MPKGFPPRGLIIHFAAYCVVIAALATALLSSCSVQPSSIGARDSNHAGGGRVPASSGAAPPGPPAAAASCEAERWRYGPQVRR